MGNARCVPWRQERHNVIVMTTSNITEAIDLAFVDRYSIDRIAIAVVDSFRTSPPLPAPHLPCAAVSRCGVRKVRAERLYMAGPTSSSTSACRRRAPFTRSCGRALWS